jgi:small subunit ribosomal protein S14
MFELYKYEIFELIIMKYIIKKDIKTRGNFLAREQKLICLKSLVRNQAISDKIKTIVREDILRLNKSAGFVTRIRNRCYITGRAGSVYSKFNLSRMKLRELAHTGMLAGIKKSSW